MQRQVDADEEAEQRRLEEEIAASRLARLRRSHATGEGSRSSDLSKISPSLVHDIDIDTIPPAERYNSQPRMPWVKNEGSDGIALAKIQSSTNAKPPISLAAFMGGNATGPRLNRHAPQQDAHDPTQFHQRKDDFAPHPIFGKGGVALAGMASKGLTTIEVDGQSIDRSSKTVATEYSVSTTESPLTVKLERGPALRTPNLRERTTSTSVLPSRSPPAQVKHVLAPSRSNGELKTANQERDTGFRGLSTTAVAKPVERPVTPHKEHGSLSKPSSKSSITTPSLGRPVQPQPRYSNGPQIPVSDIPSPAFLRPPPQKDPTPSISRLQGRGFVQSMVKVSQQLERSPTPDGDSRQASGRRASVLERWQPNLAASPPPPVSPTPKSVRRSVTVDPVSAALDQQRASMAASPKRLKPARSSSSLRQTNVEAFPSVDPSSDFPVEDNKGLGSATTLLVYKPTSLSSPVVDEFGLKSDAISKSDINTAGKLPASSGKPLFHPTRDRARKPLNSRQPESTMYPQNSESLISAHPVELSESPVTPPLSSISLTTVKAAAKIGTVANHLADISTVGPKLPDSDNVTKQPSNRLIRSALPGMVIPERPGIIVEFQDETLQDKDPIPIKQDAKSSNTVPSGEKLLVPISPRSRIPSTGNRATVMDVAKVLKTQSPEPEPDPKTQPRSLMFAAANQPRNLIPSPVHMERRKSNQEKYSAIILPSLKEDTTPTTLPATLSHPISIIHEQKNIDTKPGSPIKRKHDDDVLLPSVNIEPLINPSVLFSADLNSETISVDIMVVMGNTSIVVSQDPVVFYDTELLVIVHRSKSRITSLVSTTVWAWRGKRCTLGEKGNAKLQELAKRYGTSANIVQQHSEPLQLVHVLGGQLAIRQGVRAHWTPENTTMHLIRSKGGVIFVDEHDLSIQSLCSGFSYCLAILGTVYVWYGCGSTPGERQAALQYARSIEVGETTAIELYEGRKNNDEMFWMILGDEEYANADYWKWRNISPSIDPHIWRVTASPDKDALCPVDSFLEESSFHTSVYIIDCVWEVYVMVGIDARGHRQDIGLALRVALELSARVAPTRPYAPTAHVLILPSQLPHDLRLNFRDLDELSINNGKIPNHMNILSSMDALDHLQKTSWDNAALQDQTMLPLGVSP